MHERFPYNEDEVAEGLRDGWLSEDAPFFGVPVMPQWPQAERTQYVMYEITTEGTPISPAFATAEELARWLADTRASAFANMSASYEAWLATIAAGSVPSFIVENGRLVAGVEAVAR